MNFGQYIARKRKEKQMSQTELAMMIIMDGGRPISPQYLNDIEHGRRNPSSDEILDQLAKILEIDNDYLKYLTGRFPTDVLELGLTQEKFVPLFETFRKASKTDGDG